MKRYVFRSHSSRTVTVTTEGGEDYARQVAMRELWGPPRGWCLNAGLGLDLVEQKEIRDKFIHP